MVRNDRPALLGSPAQGAAPPGRIVKPFLSGRAVVGVDAGIAFGEPRGKVGAGRFVLYVADN
jgi:hypothetical protein